MASNQELRQIERPVQTHGRFGVLGLFPRVAVLLFVAFTALGVVLLSELASRDEAADVVPAFVGKQLGAARPTAGLARAAWGLAREHGTWDLTLSLDDSALPVPYVIDPAVETFRQVASANTGANASTLTVTKPVGLAVDDVMVAAITARGGTNTF